MKRPSSTKKMKKVGILRFFKQFSRIYIKGKRYRVDKMDDRAEPCPTPTLM